MDEKFIWVGIFCFQFQDNKTIEKIVFFENCF